jgi:outer membrane protein
MKNLPIILNIILFALVGHLYYLNSSKSQGTGNQVIVPPASQAGGVKIAWVNADTLNEKYVWLKQQQEAIDKRVSSAEANIAARQSALMKDAQAVEERAQGGTMTQAEYEKEMAGLQKRGRDLQNDVERMQKSIEDDQKKATDEKFKNLEAKLKEISGQIGYDYILSYRRGGSIYLANDSLNITKQVLDMLNAQEEKKQ